VLSNYPKILFLKDLKKIKSIPTQKLSFQKSQKSDLEPSEGGIKKNSNCGVWF
jgi:hypothetical protein